jgi:hypothetical protein
MEVYSLLLTKQQISYTLSHYQLKQMNQTLLLTAETDVKVFARIPIEGEQNGKFLSYPVLKQN